jgi:hypothetical protein
MDTRDEMTAAEKAEQAERIEMLNAQIALMEVQLTAATTQLDRDCWELRLRIACADLQGLRG